MFLSPLFSSSNFFFFCSRPAPRGAGRQRRRVVIALDHLWCWGGIASWTIYSSPSNGKLVEKKPHLAYKTPSLGAFLFSYLFSFLVVKTLFPRPDSLSLSLFRGDNNQKKRHEIKNREKWYKPRAIRLMMIFVYVLFWPTFGFDYETLKIDCILWDEGLIVTNVTSLVIRLVASSYILYLQFFFDFLELLLPTPRRPVAKHNTSLFALVACCGPVQSSRDTQLEI